MKKKILLYGGKSTAYIIHDMLKEKKITPTFIFDEYIEKPYFKSNCKFSNKTTDLKIFVQKSNHFFVCIGMMDGMLRDYVSNFFIKKKLKPISVISNTSNIDKSVKYGHGLLAMPNSVLHKHVTIGNNCYLNVNSVVDHESIIGNGVHIMGSAYIAGRVIGKGSIVGAGSVVTKDVKPGEVGVGNPARFLKKNKKKYNFRIY